MRRIVRLINALLSEAIRVGASDIHIESFEKKTLCTFTCGWSNGVKICRTAPRARTFAGITYLRSHGKAGYCRKTYSTKRVVFHYVWQVVKWMYVYDFCRRLMVSA